MVTSMSVHRLRAGLGLLSVFAGALAVALAASGTSVEPARAQERPGTMRQFSVSARKYAFQPTVVEVQQDDLVKITFDAVDIPHSFTVDEYRISKRAAPGQPVTFEFRADRPGRFPIYCNLKIDDGCRQMRGELVVLAR
jgi:heme/copper-type cytochrome/quinol oxidase subunit 2